MLSLFWIDLLHGLNKDSYKIKLMLNTLNELIESKGFIIWIKNIAEGRPSVEYANFFFYRYVAYLSIWGDTLCVTDQDWFTIFGFEVFFFHLCDFSEVDLKMMFTGLAFI